MGDIFTQKIRGLKIEGKIGFIATDVVSAAKRQVKLTGEEENIVIDIYCDQSEEDDDSDVKTFDDILCHLAFSDNEDMGFSEL